MTHYYNEHNAYRAAVLRERMEEGLLPKGVVDERDIETVPDEYFIGYTQIHLFAGIGGFPFGLRLAGFPEDRRIVTGGFPCQDISNAGKRAGITGARSGLWRQMVRCVRVVRPEFVFVENVAALLCRGMGDVLGDLAEIGYDAEGDCVSAADVGAPHLRRRIWIVAHAIGDGVRDESIAEQRSGGATIVERAGEVSDDSSERTRRLPVRSGRQIKTAPDFEWSGASLADAAKRGQPVCGQSSRRDGFAARSGEAVANASGGRFQVCPALPQGESPAQSCGEAVPDSTEQRPPLTLQLGKPESVRDAANTSRWPVEPDVGRVAHGIPKRVDRLAALGDAIVPQCVQEVVRRFFS